MTVHKLSLMRHVPFSKGSGKVDFLRFHHHRKNHQTRVTLTTPQIPQPPHQHRQLHLTAVVLHRQLQRLILLIHLHPELFLLSHTPAQVTRLPPPQPILPPLHIQLIQQLLLLLTPSSRHHWNGSTIPLYSGAIPEKQSCKLSA